MCKYGIIYVSCVETPTVAKSGQIILMCAINTQLGFIIWPSDVHLLYHIEYWETLLKDLLL